MSRKITNQEVMNMGEQMLSQLKRNPLYSMWGVDEVVYVRRQIEDIWTTALEMRVETIKYPFNGMVRITYIPVEDAYKVEAGIIGEPLEEAPKHVFVFGLHETIDDMI